ncbi:hypothetical protein D3C85_1755080 [compost metagenome]
MFADERPPAFGEGLEEEPEIHRVERSRVIPTWNFRIEIVIVQREIGAGIRIGLPGNPYRVFDAAYRSFFQDLIEVA